VRVGTVKKSMGREGLAVIAQERSPEFPWLLGRRQMLDVARNSAFRGVEAEFEKFTMNPRSAPGGILLHHPPDESSNLGIELLACQWGTVSLAVAVIESALDLTRPGKANESDELGLACIAGRSTHDFFDPTRSRTIASKARSNLRVTSATRLPARFW